MNTKAIFDCKAYAIAEGGDILELRMCIDTIDRAMHICMKSMACASVPVMTFLGMKLELDPDVPFNYVDLYKDPKGIRYGRVGPLLSEEELHVETLSLEGAEGKGGSGPQKAGPATPSREKHHEAH